MSSTIGFYGGVGSVTGANFMLDTGNTAIVIDCGLEQGSDFASTTNAANFLYDPTKPFFFIKIAVRCFTKLYMNGFSRANL